MGKRPTTQKPKPTNASWNALRHPTTQKPQPTNVGWDALWRPTTQKPKPTNAGWDALRRPTPQKPHPTNASWNALPRPTTQKPHPTNVCQDMDVVCAWLHHQAEAYALSWHRDFDGVEFGVIDRSPLSPDVSGFILAMAHTGGADDLADARRRAPAILKKYGLQQ